jgi:hypothetical protein
MLDATVSVICSDRMEADLVVGKTSSTGETEDEDLSIQVLVDDFCELVQTVFPDPEIAPTLLVCMWFCHPYTVVYTRSK